MRSFRRFADSGTEKRKKAKRKISFSLETFFNGKVNLADPPPSLFRMNHSFGVFFSRGIRNPTRLVALSWQKKQILM